MIYNIVYRIHSARNLLLSYCIIYIYTYVLVIYNIMYIIYCILIYIYIYIYVYIYMCLCIHTLCRKCMSIYIKII